MIKAIIFDMDGVLSTTEDTRFKILQEITAKHGLKLDDSTFRLSLGKKTVPFLTEVFGDKITEDIAKQIHLEKQRISKEQPERFVKGYPGAVETVRELSKEFKIGLASNASQFTIGLVLKTLNIRNCFDAIISSDDVSRLKPYGDIYEKAAEALDMDVKDCIAVEDTNIGISAAKSAGMRCIAVRSTQPDEKLREADAIIDNISQLRGYVDEHKDS